MSNDPTLTEALDSWLDDRLRGLHVGMPGKVESYDRTTQRASVQPLIQRAFIDEEGARQVETLPIINDVPVIFMRASGFAITFDLTKGDGVWLSFSDFSIDKWLKHGGLVDPLDDRNHDLSDAVCFAGLTHSATDQVASGALVMAAPELRLGSKDASELVALKSDMDSLKTYIDTHTHAGVTTGGGVSGVPSTPAPTPVGSSKVKVD